MAYLFYIPYTEVGQNSLHQTTILIGEMLSASSNGNCSNVLNAVVSSVAHVFHMKGTTKLIMYWFLIGEQSQLKILFIYGCLPYFWPLSGYNSDMIMNNV